MRYEGHFTVPGIGTILQNPGATGGFNWGSVSVDEVNNLMVVNPLYMANQLTLIPRDQLPEGVVGSQLGTPYSHNTQRFMSPLHVPCMQPCMERLVLLISRLKNYFGRSQLEQRNTQAQHSLEHLICQPDYL